MKEDLELGRMIGLIFHNKMSNLIVDYKENDMLYRFLGDYWNPISDLRQQDAIEKFIIKKESITDIHTTVMDNGKEYLTQYFKQNGSTRTVCEGSGKTRRVAKYNAFINYLKKHEYFIQDKK